MNDSETTKIAICSMQPLSEAEKVIRLNKLKEKVSQVLPTKFQNDDAFLSRWLIARDYNVDKAAAMLIQYLSWREREDIDSLLTWNPPEDIQIACPYQIHTQGSDGRPVLLFPWARWKSWEFVDKGRRDEYVKYMYQMLEKCVVSIRPPATQFVVVADSQGFSYYKHMTKVRAIDTNLEVLRGFESRYPELMHSAFAINCPKVFSMIYALIRPLMSARTHSKLFIFDTNCDHWRKCLGNQICPLSLPPYYRHDKQEDVHNEKEM